MQGGAFTYVHPQGELLYSTRNRLVYFSQRMSRIHKASLAVGYVYSTLSRHPETSDYAAERFIGAAFLIPRMASAQPSPDLRCSLLGGERPIWQYRNSHLLRRELRGCARPTENTPHLAAPGKKRKCASHGATTREAGSWKRDRVGPPRRPGSRFSLRIALVWKLCGPRNSPRPAGRIS